MTEPEKKEVDWPPLESLQAQLETYYSQTQLTGFHPESMIKEGERFYQRGPRAVNFGEKDGLESIQHAQRHLRALQEEIVKIVPHLQEAKRHESKSGAVRRANELQRQIWADITYLGQVKDRINVGQQITLVERAVFLAKLTLGVAALTLVATILQVIFSIFS